MSNPADGSHEDCVGAMCNTTSNNGYCVFCERHLSNIFLHNIMAHGGNENYEVRFYTNASRYLATSGVLPDSELKNCDRCDAIMYKHRIQNHLCRGTQIDLFAQDEGRGNEFCLMCQLRCDDVSAHWNDAHESNEIYKILKIQELQTLLPKCTQDMDLEYFSGHDNHELCQRFTYKNRTRRLCILESYNNYIYEAIQKYLYSTSGYVYQGIGWPSPHENLSQPERYSRSTAIPGFEINQEIRTHGVFPVEWNNTLEQWSNPNFYLLPIPRETHSNNSALSGVAPYLPTGFEPSSYFAKPNISQIETDSGFSGVFSLQSGSTIPYSTYKIVEHAGQESIFDPIATPGTSKVAKVQVQLRERQSATYWDERSTNSGYCVIFCSAPKSNIHQHARSMQHARSGIGPFIGRRILAPVGSFERNELSKCEACIRVFHSKNAPNHNCGDEILAKIGRPKILYDEETHSSGFCAICEKRKGNIYSHSKRFHRKYNGPYPLQTKHFKGNRVLSSADSFDGGKLTKCEICKLVFLTERFRNHKCAPQTAPAVPSNTGSSL